MPKYVSMENIQGILHVVPLRIKGNGKQFRRKVTRARVMLSCFSVGKLLCNPLVSSPLYSQLALPSNPRKRQGGWVYLLLNVALSSLLPPVLPLHKVQQPALAPNVTAPGELQARAGIEVCSFSVQTAAENHSAGVWRCLERNLGTGLGLFSCCHTSAVPYVFVFSTIVCWRNCLAENLVWFWRTCLGL